MIALLRRLRRLLGTYDVEAGLDRSGEAGRRPGRRLP